MLSLYWKTYAVVFSLFSSSLWCCSIVILILNTKDLKRCVVRVVCGDAKSQREIYGTLVVLWRCSMQRGDHIDKGALGASFLGTQKTAKVGWRVLTDTTRGQNILLRLCTSRLTVSKWNIFLLRCLTTKAMSSLWKRTFHHKEAFCTLRAREGMVVKRRRQRPKTPSSAMLVSRTRGVSYNNRRKRQRRRAA